MGRIRTIKPEFPQSESVGRLSRDARLLFLQLWTVVDDEGRARASSRLLASTLYPYDDDAVTLMPTWLEELESEDMIIRYESDGSTYLYIPKWMQHQKIDHAAKSKLPIPHYHSEDTREDSRGLASVSRSLAPDPRSLAPDLDLGPRTMDQYQDQKHLLANASDFAPREPQVYSPNPILTPTLVGDGELLPDHRQAIYAAYPRKISPRAAKREIEAAIQRLAKGEHPSGVMNRLSASRFLYAQTVAYSRSEAVCRGDPAFIPHPERWFKKARYLDDPATWQITGGQSARIQPDRSRTGGNYSALEAALAGLESAADRTRNAG